MTIGELSDALRERVARAICRAGTSSESAAARNWDRYADLYMRDADAALAVIYPAAHVGGNAEDCPACGPDVQYPWICPATPARNAERGGSDV